MKIAVTADVHLTDRENHPERYNALEDILKQMTAEKISTLIIAGDLFDKGMQNYSEFESLCSKYSEVKFHIIPGNHDPDISKRQIVGDNIAIYTTPELIQFDSVHFLFIPYSVGTAMGEKVAEVSGDISGKDWILVGHGDYLGASIGRNTYEPGTYMPLNRKDIQQFKPLQVVLGHIHKSTEYEKVCYAGSPCGIDINETDRRSFVLYDTEENTIIRKAVNTDVIYLKKNFLLIPDEDEQQKLTLEIQKCIAEWNLSPSEISKVRLRITATGYSSDRSAVLKTLNDEFAGFSFFKDESPNIENLLTSDNMQLREVAGKTKKLIDELDWNYGGNEPAREEVLEAALCVIYGEGGG